MSAARLQRAINDAIERLELELSDLVVYTEAATGPFAATAALAAAAGARKVVAIARDWASVPAHEAIRETQAIAATLGVVQQINIATERRDSDLAAADVVTNLGAVRPIDRRAVMALKPTAAIAYMREAWELRDDDVDLRACRERGIPVFATDEHHPDVGVFDSCGVLALSLLLQGGVDVGRARIVVLSGDAFGPTIADCLGKLGARVVVAASAAACHELLPGADALVVADFTSPAPLVAPGGPLEPATLATLVPGLTVIAFAGGVDATALGRVGLQCIPREGSAPRRMGRTLADLGPRPVVDLHAAGLKVGAAAARGRRAGLTGGALAEYVCRLAPAAVMTAGG